MRDLIKASNKATKLTTIETRKEAIAEAWFKTVKELLSYGVSRDAIDQIAREVQRQLPELIIVTNKLNPPNALA